MIKIQAALIQIISNDSDVSFRRVNEHLQGQNRGIALVTAHFGVQPDEAFAQHWAKVGCNPLFDDTENLSLRRFA